MSAHTHSHAQAQSRNHTQPKQSTQAVQTIVIMMIMIIIITMVEPKIVQVALSLIRFLRSFLFFSLLVDVVVVLSFI